MHMEPDSVNTYVDLTLRMSVYVWNLSEMEL